MLRRTIARAVPLAAVLASAGPVAAGAQSAIYGAGLQAWLGCWAAEPVVTRTDGSAAIVCVTPTSDQNVADLLTIVDGRVLSREKLDASGRQRPIDAERCEGVRSARWSSDGRRLFVRSSGSCAGVASSTSGVLSVTSEGDWLDVEGISAGGATSVRVARYREVAPPATLPIGARAALRAQSLATRSVRVAAGAPVRAEDVLEAARTLDSAVVEGWILERAQRFDVSDADLRALVASGVAARVADALAAVADPPSYALARADDRAGAPESSVYYDRYALPLGWGWGWGYYPSVGGRYGARSRDTWRYGSYRPPIVIVRGHDGRPRGRVGDGRGGYRPGDGRDGRTGGSQRPRDDAPRADDPRRGTTTRDPRRAQPTSGGTVRLGAPRD
jgi:hypothetical protein